VDSLAAAIDSKRRNDGPRRFARLACRQGNGCRDFGRDLCRHREPRTAWFRPRGNRSRARAVGDSIKARSSKVRGPGPVSTRDSGRKLLGVSARHLSRAWTVTATGDYFGAQEMSRPIVSAYQSTVDFASHPRSTATVQ